MKAIGGLFHQLLINNEDELKDEDLERVNRLIIDTVENKTGAKIRS